MKHTMKYGMQNKSIRKHLRHVIYELSESITDESVRNIVLTDSIITGGAVASMLMGDKINDYDIYFRTKESTKAVAEYYVQKFLNIEIDDPVHDSRLSIPARQIKPNSYNIEVKESTSTNILGIHEDRISIRIDSSGSAKDLSNTEELYSPKFLTDNAISLSNDVQLITRFYGEPSEIHENYDFVHAKCYYDVGNDILETPLESIRAMQTKTLRYEGSLYPVASLFRIRKFLERDWRISAGEILKIALQISKIDLLNPKVLADQLIGVDILYFHMMLQQLENTPKDENGNYSEGYIIELINDLFGDI